MGFVCMVNSGRQADTILSVPFGYKIYLSYRKNKVCEEIFKKSSIYQSALVCDFSETVDGCVTLVPLRYMTLSQVIEHGKSCTVAMRASTFVDSDNYCYLLDKIKSAYYANNKKLVFSETSVNIHPFDLHRELSNFEFICDKLLSCHATYDSFLPFFTTIGIFGYDERLTSVLIPEPLPKLEKGNKYRFIGYFYSGNKNNDHFDTSVYVNTRGEIYSMSYAPVYKPVGLDWILDFPFGVCNNDDIYSTRDAAIFIQHNDLVRKIELSINNTSPSNAFPSKNRFFSKLKEKILNFI